MLVNLTKPYSPTAGVVLNPGEHELDESDVARAKACGALQVAKRAPTTEKQNKPPKNRAKTARQTK